jgi:hypothetical protein
MAFENWIQEQISMQSRSILRTAVFGLACVHTLALQAAQLDGIKGRIFVSQGAGYRVASAPIRLDPGDSVLANPNSSARVVFDDGCVVSIQPGMVFSVPETSPCKGAQAYFFGHEVNWPLVAGAVAVATGVGIAIAASGDDDDGILIPISP